MSVLGSYSMENIHGYIFHQQIESCYQEGMDFSKLLKVILLQLILENHDGKKKKENHDGA